MKVTRFSMHYDKKSIDVLVVHPIRVFMGTIYIILVMMLSLIIYHVDHKMATINSQVWVVMMCYTVLMDFLVIQPVLIIAARFFVAMDVVSFFEKLCFWRGYARYDPEELKTKV